MANSCWLAGVEGGGGGGGLRFGSGVSGFGHKASMKKGNVGFVPKAAMEKENALLACEWPNLWAAEEVASPSSFSAESTAESARVGEEECEDYLSGLAEEIAQSMLEEDEESSEKNVPWVLEGSKSAWGSQKTTLPTSPQSTLAGIGCCAWDVSRTANSGGFSSGVSSPPTPVAASELDEDDALDLLYAELFRLKREDQAKAILLQQQQQQYEQLLLKIRQSTITPQDLVPSDTGYVKGKGGSLFSPCSPTLNKGSSPAGVTSSCRRSKARNEEQNQLRTRKQVGACWGGPALQQQHQQSNSGNGNSRQRSWGAMDTTQLHYPHFSFNSSQQQASNGSGMRAVFLGGPGSRESGGTGVFLPRRIGSGPDIKRKPACSTVLLPSRIVQALNLNVEDTLACSMPSPTTTSRDNVLPTSTARRNSPIPTKIVDGGNEWSPASLHVPSCSPPLQEVTPDISLPTEWTY